MTTNVSSYRPSRTDFSAGCPTKVRFCEKKKFLALVLSHNSHTTLKQCAATIPKEQELLYISVLNGMLNLLGYEMLKLAKVDFNFDGFISINFKILLKKRGNPDF